MMLSLPLLSIVILSQGSATPNNQVERLLIPSEVGTIDKAKHLVELGAYGEAERLLRKLKSPLARARWALLVASDAPLFRDRGISEYHADEAAAIAKKNAPVLLRSANTDPDCAGLIAAFYMSGIGFPIDEYEGVRWLRIAADRGNHQAMLRLGLCNLNGIGTKKDSKTAFTLIKRAVEAGNTAAMARLGALYEDGNGTTSNQILAMNYYTDSAKAGNIDGMLNAARMLSTKAKRASELNDTLATSK